VLNKLKKLAWPSLRAWSSLLVKSSFLAYVGSLPVMAYMGRISSKWVPFPGLRYTCNYKMRGISHVEVFERVGKSVI